MKTYPDTDIEKLEVKTCPFCGEKPELTKHHKDPMWSLLHRCKIMGPLTIDWRESLSDIVRQWNTRASVALFGLAQESHEVYGHGDNGKEQRICRQGSYGSGQFPPCFTAKEAADDYVKKHNRTHPPFIVVPLKLL